MEHHGDGLSPPAGPDEGNVPQDRDHHSVPGATRLAIHGVRHCTAAEDRSLTDLHRWWRSWQALCRARGRLTASSRHGYAARACGSDTVGRRRAWCVQVACDRSWSSREPWSLARRAGGCDIHSGRGGRREPPLPPSRRPLRSSPALQRAWGARPILAVAGHTADRTEPGDHRPGTGSPDPSSSGRRTQARSTCSHTWTTRTTLLFIVSPAQWPPPARSCRGGSP
jgi:hypothetical protein